MTHSEVWLLVLIFNFISCEQVLYFTLKNTIVLMLQIFGSVFTHVILHAIFLWLMSTEVLPQLQFHLASIQVLFFAKHEGPQV